MSPGTIHPLIIVIKLKLNEQPLNRDGAFWKRFADLREKSVFFPSDTFVKPNLWLLVNPSIACPIQYGEMPSDLQTVSEPAGEIQTDPAQTRLPVVQEVLLSSEYTVHLMHPNGCGKFIKHLEILQIKMFGRKMSFFLWFGDQEHVSSSQEPT